MKGIVFNIERYALEDGPGIRTVVFFKGCPMSCDWCANPESQQKRPQIMYISNNCRLCGRCIKICPSKAVRANDEFGIYTDNSKCTMCSMCIDVCYYRAREITGTIMSVEEVMAAVLRDKDFYIESGGGVTFSGGEPLLQSKFLKKLLEACKDEKIHTAVETCMYTDNKDNLNTLLYTDLIYADIKHIDSVVHTQRTKVGNDIILNNIKWLDQSNKRMILRVPYIPRFNDEIDVQLKLYRWASELKNLQWIEILPYHRLGILKYRGLGRKYSLEDYQPVKKNDLHYLVDIGAQYDIKVNIGAV